MERVQELEDDLSRALDRINENERHFMYKLADLNSELTQVRNERDELSQMKRKNEEEVSTLRRVLQQNEQELKNRQNQLEHKNLELETLSKSLPKGVSIHDKLAELAIPSSDTICKYHEFYERLIHFQFLIFFLSFCFS